MIDIYQVKQQKNMDGFYKFVLRAHYSPPRY